LYINENKFAIETALYSHTSMKSNIEGEPI